MSKSEDTESHVNLTTGLIFGGILLLAFLYKSTRRRKGLPPGPPGIPFLGSFPFLGTKDLREALIPARRKYGDLLTINIGTRDVVVLNSYEVIKDALVNHADVFSGRPPTPILKMSGQGIIFANGSFWREQRKFAHGVLREFGVGRNLLEEKIKEELELLLKHLQQHAGNIPLNMSNILHTSVSNIICSIAFGKHFEYEDPEFKTLLKALDSLIRNAGVGSILNLLPLLQYLPGDIFGTKAIYNGVKEMFKRFQRYIEEHRSSRTPGQVRDYIDAFLEQMDKEKGKENSTFFDEQLVVTIANLFNAGTETTATTLKWAIIYLLYNPDMQDRIFKEIKDELGDRLPSMKDKTNLPFTEAFLLESQRMGAIVPLSVPHQTTGDVNLRGYFIPKGTRVLINIHGTHFDPEFWKEPNKFDPTRFLGSDGKVEKNEHLIPFSMGRRVCLGESMARMELFLFFTGMMQRFKFKLPPGHTLPDKKGHVGFVNVTPDFEVLIEPHN